MATLKDLYPQVSLEKPYTPSKNDVRDQGSLKQILKKPSRLPESSRQYFPGDPTKYIDWRAYARSDQLLIREQRGIARAELVIWVDLGETMFWPTAETTVDPPPSKAEVALRIALHHAYFHFRLGDGVRFYVSFSLEQVAEITMRSANDVSQVFHSLSSDGFTAPAIKKFGVSSRLPKGGDLFYLLTDGLTELGAPAAADLCRQRVFFHILSSMEVSPNWLTKDHSYFDRDLGVKEFLGSTLLARKTLQVKVEEFVHKLSERMTGAGFYTLALSDNTPIGSYLAAIHEVGVN